MDHSLTVNISDPIEHLYGKHQTGFEGKSTTTQLFQLLEISTKFRHY